MPKKAAGFCRILQWVQAHHPDLHEAIDQLCLSGLFSARRRGVTFLCPGAAARKRIAEGAFGDDAAMQGAIDLLKASVIPQPVPDAAAFRAGVGSALGIKLTVDSTSSGDKAKLSPGGAEIVKAKSFRAPFRDDMYVWEVVKGEVPTEGETWVPPKGVRGSGAAVVGGAGGAAASSTPGAALRAYADRVCSAYCSEVAAHGASHANAYLVAVVSLMNYLKAKEPARYAALLPLLDRSPGVSFYLLLEPFYTGARRLVPLDCFASWGGVPLTKNSVDEFRAFFEEADSSNAQSLRSAVDRVRLNLLGEDGSRCNRVETPQKLAAAYAALAERNTIDGQGPVYPAATLAALRGASMLLGMDEFRFVGHLADTAARHGGDASDWLNVVSSLAARGGATPLITDGAQLSANVDPRAEFQMLVRFISSTDFLRGTAPPAAMVSKAWGQIPQAAAVPKGGSADLTVINTEASRVNQLDRLAAGGANATRAPPPGLQAAAAFYSAAPAAAAPAAE